MITLRVASLSLRALACIDQAYVSIIFLHGLNGFSYLAVNTAIGKISIQSLKSYLMSECSDFHSNEITRTERAASPT